MIEKNENTHNKNPRSNPSFNCGEKSEMGKSLSGSVRKILHISKRSANSMSCLKE